MSLKLSKIFEDIITPGPAEYNPLNLDKKSSYTFGHKYKEKAKEMTPSQGNYNIRAEKALTIPSSIFDREKKLDWGYINKSSGPAKYSDDINSTNARHPKYSFGKEKRVMDKINDNPGPGNYMHKEYTGKEGKKISMDLKFKSKSMEYFPWPGQYKTDNYNPTLKK